MESNYTILAIHHPIRPENPGVGVPGVPIDKVFARVRMYLADGTIVDENFEFPRPITEEEQLNEFVVQRLDELDAGKIDVSESAIAHSLSEQEIVVVEPSVTEAILERIAKIEENVKNGVSGE